MDEPVELGVGTGWNNDAQACIHRGAREIQQCLTKLQVPFFYWWDKLKASNSLQHTTIHKTEAQKLSPKPRVMQDLQLTKQPAQNCLICQ